MPSAPYRVVSFNLIILLVAVVSTRLLNRYDELGYALITAIFIAVQLFSNLLFAFFRHDSDMRAAHLLSVFLVLLIGFGACMAVGAIRV